MNYDLAIMALEGMARAPLRVTATGSGEVVVEGSSATFKELARLCLLLGGTHTPEDAFDLEPGLHVTEGSPALRLKLLAE
jgi:hypothetical protein